MCIKIIQIIHYNLYILLYVTAQKNNILYLNLKSIGGGGRWENEEAVGAPLLKFGIWIN